MIFFTRTSLKDLAWEKLPVAFALRVQPGSTKEFLPLILTGCGLHLQCSACLLSVKVPTSHAFSFFHACGFHSGHSRKALSACREVNHSSLCHHDLRHSSMENCLQEIKKMFTLHNGTVFQSFSTSFIDKLLSKIQGKSNYFFTPCSRSLVTHDI